uniref:AlNc14C196G8575 protein n=1 Tax=Albugo laibachii Nc14 TaxID=890382 RepID=F0WQ94_9STRA|nr:AlNc14C196G8575 [Albugo laibachii Nc14]|eukprot:CCA23500.1 AlNc14C196G8575 [Albugo laibachii Nc14]
MYTRVKPSFIFERVATAKGAGATTLGNLHQSDFLASSIPTNTFGDVLIYGYDRVGYIMAITVELRSESRRVYSLLHTREAFYFDAAMVLIQQFVL